MIKIILFPLAFGTLIVVGCQPKKYKDPISSNLVCDFINQVINSVEFQDYYQIGDKYIESRESRGVETSIDSVFNIYKESQKKYYEDRILFITAKVDQKNEIDWNKELDVVQQLSPLHEIAPFNVILKKKNENIHGKCFETNIFEDNIYQIELIIFLYDNNNRITGLLKSSGPFGPKSTHLIFWGDGDENLSKIRWAEIEL